MAAVEQHQVRRVVLISSLGATTVPGHGTVTYTGTMEEAFDQLPATTSVLALWLGYFLENLLLQVPRLQASGKFVFPFDPAPAIPFVSTNDIGDAAARYLVSTQWAGHWKLNLMGPENLTLPAMAQRLTALLGRPIRYQRDHLADSVRQFATLGANPIMQQEMADLLTTLGDSRGPYATPRTPEATTPTTLEQFARAKLLPQLALPH